MIEQLEENGYKRVQTGGVQTGGDGAYRRAMQGLISGMARWKNENCTVETSTLGLPGEHTDRQTNYVPVEEDSDPRDGAKQEDDGEVADDVAVSVGEFSAIIILIIETVL